MNTTSKILFEYLRDVFYDPSKAALDIDTLDGDFVDLGKGLAYFAQCFDQYNRMALALARGDLSFPPPPPENELAAPLKSLHASLKHLSWQSQQVAKGDYKQRVDFMGDFSHAFNTMIEQLAERQQKLEEEIELGRKKTVALEQSNQLLTNITRHITQQIIVVDRDTQEVLYLNDSARKELNNDARYLEKLFALIPGHSGREDRNNTEIQFEWEEGARYFSISSYFLEWNKSNAEAFVISDISAEKNQMKELETYAYRDTMTNLYNRFSGMLALNRWVEEKRVFSLIFADLDNLKYINDKYGHSEGDIYIISAAKHLKTFSANTMVCRVGGDEFMILGPDTTFDEARIRMERILRQLQTDEHLNGKDYSYSLSFGIVAVDKDNRLSASDILSLADERMYEQKRLKKQQRREG